jgi:hypothetical protein
MKEFTETLRAVLDNVGALTEVVLNAISLVFIVAGAVLSLTGSVKERKRLPGVHPLHTFFRTENGLWRMVGCSTGVSVSGGYCRNDYFTHFGTPD